MVKIVVETFGEVALRKLYCDQERLYIRKDYQKEFRWDKECELCKMPTLLHCDTSGKRLLGSCTSLSRPELWRSGSKLRNSWSLFKRKMRQVVGKPDTIEKQKAKEFELLDSIMHSSYGRTRLEKPKAKEFKLIYSIMHSPYG